MSSLFTVAHAAGLDFIRAEGYAYAHVADEGIIEASAAKLLRHRRMIGAERVQVWADVKKKHSAHAITADVIKPCLRLKYCCISETTL
jgi:predicted TIM-barrel enzyme